MDLCNVSEDFEMSHPAVDDIAASRVNRRLGAPMFWLVRQLVSPILRSPKEPLWIFGHGR